MQLEQQPENEQQAQLNPVQPLQDMQLQSHPGRPGLQALQVLCAALQDIGCVLGPAAMAAATPELLLGLDAADFATAGAAVAAGVQNLDTIMRTIGHLVAVVDQCNGDEQLMHSDHAQSATLPSITASRCSSNQELMLLDLGEAAYVSNHDAAENTLLSDHEDSSGMQCLAASRCQRTHDYQHAAVKAQQEGCQMTEVAQYADQQGGCLQAVEAHDAAVDAQGAASLGHQDSLQLPTTWSTYSVSGFTDLNEDDFNLLCSHMPAHSSTCGVDPGQGQQIVTADGTGLPSIPMASRQTADDISALPERQTHAASDTSAPAVRPAAKSLPVAYYRHVSVDGSGCKSLLDHDPSFDIADSPATRPAQASTFPSAAYANHQMPQSRHGRGISPRLLRRSTWDVAATDSASLAAAARAQAALKAFMAAAMAAGAGGRKMVGRVLQDGSVSIQPEDSITDASSCTSRASSCKHTVLPLTTAMNETKPAAASEEGARCAASTAMAHQQQQQVIADVVGPAADVASSFSNFEALQHVAICQVLRRSSSQPALAMTPVTSGGSRIVSCAAHDDASCETHCSTSCCMTVVAGAASTRCVRCGSSDDTIDSPAPGADGITTTSITCGGSSSNPETSWPSDAQALVRQQRQQLVDAHEKLAMLVQQLTTSSADYDLLNRELQDQKAQQKELVNCLQEKQMQVRTMPLQ
jgi:cytochrome c1